MLFNAFFFKLCLHVLCLHVFMCFSKPHVYVSNSCIGPFFIFLPLPSFHILPSPPLLFLRLPLPSTLTTPLLPSLPLCLLHLYLSLSSVTVSEALSPLSFSVSISFSSGFLSCWDWMQVLTHPRQALSCWALSPALFLTLLLHVCISLLLSAPQDI